MAAKANEVHHKAAHSTLLRGLVLFAAFLGPATGATAQGAPPAAPQSGQGGAPAVPPTQRAIAPIDLTGYWVSIVTEDWRFRMITPDKGDVTSIPVNAQGRQVTNLWDPDKDIASGNQCRSYGAPALMRVPGRLHISWTDDDTLKVETDAGTQTRQFHLEPAVAPEELLAKVPANRSPSLQGYSIAEWQGLAPGAAAGGLSVNAGAGAHKGYLRVVTTHLQPGYLRKNGVPYSENTLLEEYYDSFTEDNGDKWLVITTIVTDPKYLMQPFVTSTHFKAEASGAKWAPSACQAK